MNLLKSLFAVFFSFCLLSCSGYFLTNAKDNPQGAIYGKVDFSDPQIKPNDILVSIANTSRSVEVNTSGYFFIPDIPIGSYSLIVKVQNAIKGSIEMIEVSKDSISIVAIHLSNKDNRYYWGLIKIKEIDINKRGGIKGKVFNLETKKALNNGYIRIEGSPWYTYADSTGAYELEGILPGSYSLTATSMGFNHSVMYFIDVQENENIIVDFILDNLPLD